MAVEYSPYQQEVSLLYVSTRTGWPNTPQGSRGYIITVDSPKPDDYWQEKYNIAQMTTHIFCYQVD